MFHITPDGLSYLGACLFCLSIVCALLWLDKTHTRKQSSPLASPSRSQLLHNLEQNQRALRASKFSPHFPQPSKSSLRNTPKTLDTHYHCVGIYPHGLVKEFCCGTRYRAAEQARACLRIGMNTVFLRKKSSLSCQTKAELSSPSSDRLPNVSWTESTLRRTQPCAAVIHRQGVTEIHEHLL